jgi:hypothetical protein
VPCSPLKAVASGSILTLLVRRRRDHMRRAEPRRAVEHAPADAPLARPEPDHDRPQPRGKMSPARRATAEPDNSSCARQVARQAAATDTRHVSPSPRAASSIENVVIWRKDDKMGVGRPRAHREAGRRSSWGRFCRCC